jgi:pimeloyl-ACP methyl ester carboxylesterase
MATFILIHGAFHGGWCWEDVVRRLAAAGHHALAPDLPGMGTDQQPTQDVDLAATGSFIAELARRQAGRIILAGHSLGGIAISDAAERAPEAIAGLVYVTAALLPSGASVMELIGGELQDGVTLSHDGAYCIVSPGYARNRLFDACPEDQVESALARLTPQPIQVMRDRLSVSSARFGQVPRAFIECLNDNALPLVVQRAQFAAMPCDPVFSMATGHSPFLQDPDGLTAHLLAAASAFGEI